MARPPRPLVPNGIYHVTARGNRRQLIFTSDHDCRHFLSLIDRVVRRFDWRCFAFCLMPNHYHLVVQTPSPNLSAGMHGINSSYSHWFNGFHDVDGHLFQQRFHAVLVESDWHLLEVSRYVSLNPVRARLCGAPADWRWSSYRALVGKAPTPRFLAVDHLLSYFGRDPARAREALSAFVRDGMAF